MFNKKKHMFNLQKSITVYQHDSRCFSQLVLSILRSSSVFEHQSMQLKPTSSSPSLSICPQLIFPLYVEMETFDARYCADE